MRDNTWFIRQRGTGRRFRLYCFSYAGGSAAAYADWQGLLTPSVEVCAVQLPGRSARFHEPALRTLPDLIEVLAPVLSLDADMPFAFFGHSLGALVAFELARSLAQSRSNLPEHLFVSGCHAPQFRDMTRNFHDLDDDALIEVLKDYNGTPAEVLAHRELINLLLPTIRADFSLAETYRYRPGPRLPVPMTALAGRKDERSCIEQVTGWERETNAGFTHRWFEGDHFFLNDERDALLHFIEATLAVGGDFSQPTSPLMRAGAES